MNKRIIISESEKKRILSQHKNVIKNESDLKKQSISEREFSNLVNKVLIKEQFEQIPGMPKLPEGMGECMGKFTSLNKIDKDNKIKIKIATGCATLDVSTCSQAIIAVGTELVTKAMSDPSILLSLPNEIIEFGKCVSENFEMDLPKIELPKTGGFPIPGTVPMNEQTNKIKEAYDCSCLKNCTCPAGCSCWCTNGVCKCHTQDGAECSSSGGIKTPKPTPQPTSLKESGPCKSNSDCPPNMACYNGKCTITTSAKKMKESEVNETPRCPRGWNFCGFNGSCCPPDHLCTPDGCKPKYGGGRPIPGMPPMNEQIDEIIYEIEFNEEITEETGKMGCCKLTSKGCPNGYRCKCPEGICSKLMPVYV